MGVVVKAGPGAHIKTGQSVMYAQYGAFAEYVLLSETAVLPIPVRSLNSDSRLMAQRVDSKFFAALVTGQTAVLALECTGPVQKGDVVVITAAAGGVGTIAVQWAKRCGAHVVGVCSTDAKCALLSVLSNNIEYRFTDLDAEFGMRSGHQLQDGEFATSAQEGVPARRELGARKRRRSNAARLH